MSARESLMALGRREVEAGLRSIPAETAADVYALSFFISAADDDPRQASIAVGFNTEVNAAGRREDEAEEARWNYAMWLHDVVCEFPDRDGVGGDEWRALLVELSIDYTDAEAGAAFDAGEDLERSVRVTRLMLDVAVELSLHCHDSGLIRSVFGRTVPVIVRELEYYHAIAPA